MIPFKAFSIVPALVLYGLAGSSNRSMAAEERPDVKERRMALQARIAVMPSVTPGLDVKNVKFTTLDLKPSLTKIGDKHYCAFKFTSPPKPGQLTWAFKPPEGCTGWFIIPASGWMEKGFENYHRYELAEDFKDAGKKGDKFVLQGLMVERLKPSSEYIIWFLIPETSTAQLTLSLNVLPEKTFFENAFPMMKRIN